jgi:hypothetical protein
MLQHIIVTAVALGALFAIGRRVLGYARPTQGQPACPSCPSAKSACATPAGHNRQTPRAVNVATFYDRRSIELIHHADTVEPDGLASSRTH